MPRRPEQVGRHRPPNLSCARDHSEDGQRCSSARKAEPSGRGWRGRRRRPSAASYGVAVDDRLIAPGWRSALTLFAVIYARTRLGGAMPTRRPNR